VLAALTPTTKHVILIGDHQQLRPQVNEYTIAKKYNLEISMFERIINSGGADQTEWLSNGIVLLTKAGGGSAGLPWRVVTNSRERRDYATALDGAYKQEMEEYALKTGNSTPIKEHPGGQRYGYLQQGAPKFTDGKAPKFPSWKTAVSPL
jgi:hypothetical protein